MSKIKKIFLPNPKNFFIAFFVFIIINAFALLIIFALFDIERNYEVREMEARANEIGGHLRLKFEGYLAVSRVLKEQLINTGDGVPTAAFVREIQDVLKHFPDFQALGFVNPEGVIEFLYPLTSNEEAIGRKLFEHQIIGPILNTDQSRNKVTQSPPMNLYQGGEGVVFYLPVKIKNQFIGWVNVVIVLDRFIGRLFQEAGYSKYGIAINDKLTNSLLYRSGESIGKVQHFDIPFYEHVWTVEIWRKERSLLAILSSAMFLIIILLSFVAALVLKLYLDRVEQIKRNLKDALSEGNLLRVLCHDMSTPLTVADMLSEKLLNMPTPEIQKIGDQLQACHRKQFEMLESVRELQLLRAQKKKMPLEGIDCAHAFSALRNIFDESLRQKELKMELHDHSRGPFFYAHKAYFENHIMGNIISNAIKYGPRGSTITIDAQTVGNEVRIRIQDQGQGMPKTVVEQFNRGKPAHSTEGTEGEKGTGFGLMLVKSFVELLDGRVNICSEPTGTTVELWFKKAPAQL